MMLEKKAFDGTDHLLLIKTNKQTNKQNHIYPAIKMLEGVVSGFVLNHATKEKVGDIAVLENCEI